MIYFFVFLSIFFSIIALALVIPGLNLTSSISSSDVLSLLGILITGISFMIACYFVFRAIDIYSQLREITKHLEEVRVNKAKLESEVVTLVTTRSEISESIGKAAKSILTSINDALYTAAKSKVFSAEVKLEIMRLTEIPMRSIGRLAFIKHQLDRDRIDYLQKLGQYGNEDDLENLKELIKDPTESKEIESQAKQAYKKIQERLEEEKKHRP